MVKGISSIGSRVALLVAAMWLNGSAAELPDLIAFRQCLATVDGPTECGLAPLAQGYDVESTLTVTNRNVTAIYGQGVSSTDTTLRRAVSSMIQIMVISVDNVNVRGLQFDGNKSIISGVPPGYADLQLLGRGITVDSAYFVNAPHFAVEIAGDGASFNYCTFKDSRDAGLYSGGYQIGFTLLSNTFQNNGGSAFAIYTQSTNANRTYIQGNQVLLNYVSPEATMSTGGQLVIGTGASYCYVIDNFIDGGHLYGDVGGQLFMAYGIEAYGYNHYFAGNYIRYQTGPGMHLVGLVNATIIGGANSWEIRENDLDGIALLNFVDYPATSNVTMDGIRSNYNGWNGIRVDPRNVGQISGITVQNTASLSGNGDAPICYTPPSQVVSDVTPTVPCVQHRWRWRNVVPPDYGLGPK
jgi:hypothetical protein